MGLSVHFYTVGRKMLFSVSHRGMLQNEMQWFKTKCSKLLGEIINTMIIIMTAEPLGWGQAAYEGSQGIISFNTHINPHGILLSSLSTDEETEAWRRYVTRLKSYSY